MQVYGHLTYIVHCETLSFYMRHYCHRLDTGFSGMPTSSRWRCTHMCVSTYRACHFFDSHQNELNMTICIIAESGELELELKPRYQIQLWPMEWVEW